EAKRVDARKKEQKKIEQDAAQRQAMEQARQAMAARKEEKERKEALEASQKQARTDLEQRRSTATEQVWRLRPQVDRLRSELDIAKAAVARNEERKRELEREQEFLVRDGQAVEANRDTYYRLLEKLETAERNPTQ